MEEGKEEKDEVDGEGEWGWGGEGTRVINKGRGQEVISVVLSCIYLYEGNDRGTHTHTHSTSPQQRIYYTNTHFLSLCVQYASTNTC